MKSPILFLGLFLLLAQHSHGSGALAVPAEMNLQEARQWLSQYEVDNGLNERRYYRHVSPAQRYLAKELMGSVLAGEIAERVREAFPGQADSIRITSSRKGVARRISFKKPDLSEHVVIVEIEDQMLLDRNALSFPVPPLEYLKRIEGEEFSDSNQLLGADLELIDRAIFEEISTGSNHSCAGWIGRRRSESCASFTSDSVTVRHQTWYYGQQSRPAIFADAAATKLISVTSFKND